MDTKKQGTLKVLLRLLGAVLGFICILFGVLSLVLSLKSISLLNSITFVIMGMIFMFYGFTGKSTLRKTEQQ